MDINIQKMNFIDLFSGAGGLSEGFIRQGFTPIAHVEIDKAACNTLLTRTAYHHLKGKKKNNKYIDYLKREISRTELYDSLPENLKKSVINKPIGVNTNPEIFDTIDELKGDQPIDLIIGGPPCQAYSLVGRAKDKNGMKGDDRNYLYIQYAEFLKKYKPKVFVFENVLGLLSAKNEHGEKYLDKMIKLFREVGYETEHELLKASDFGVLQNRKRVILIGRRGKKEGFYPVFEKIESEIKVEEIFKGLPKLQAGEGEFYSTLYTKEKSKYLIESGIQNGLDFTTQHIARPHNDQDKEIYQIAVDKWDNDRERLNYNDLPSRLKTHKNRKAFTDRFKVVAEELPACHTVVAHIAKDGHYYIHPDKKQNRSLTPREAARLQSFPDDFFFEGQTEKSSRTAAFKQIGNAVPPLMAEKIAKKIKLLIHA